MTRRPTAPGREGPLRRWTLPIIPLVLMAILAACGGSSSSETPPDESAGPSAATPIGPDDSAEPTDADESEDPAEESEDPVESDEPTDEPSDEPTDEPTDEPSSPAGPASACSGSAENQDFFADAAAAVEWTVYCPVLPDGWFVVTGRYRLAGGGRLEISYRGPGGASFTLREGAFCGDPDGCIPAGSEVGDAAFGDRNGTLIAADDGSWAIVVDAGSNPSWLLVAEVASEEAARKIGASLVAVEG